MRTPGKLYGVGVGPGDPELLTLKAIKTIQKADIIAVPQTETNNIALDIVQTEFDLADKEILHIYMPMIRDNNVLKEKHAQGAQELTQRLAEGKDIAFLTLGDPSIYSTYVYLHELVLKKGFQAEIVPGIPSFCAAAARLNTSLCLGSEPLHIIPASYEGLDNYLEWKGTKVLMKSGRELPEVRETLAARGLLSNSSIVERCGMEDEKVYLNMADTDENMKTSYFTLIVVKDKENKK